MCKICIDLDKQTLTPWEAAKNRTEMLDSFGEDHLKVLDEKIRKGLLEYLKQLDEERNEN